jgi:hypothetical protein
MSALSNEDRCAVDLLLEHAQYASQGPACFTQADSGEMQERLTRMESLLSALHAYKVSDPSHDLSARTLLRCFDGAPLQAPDSDAQKSVPA